MDAKNPHARAAFKKGHELGKLLCDELNSLSYEKEISEGFAQGFIESHRTLQQSAGRTIFALFTKLAAMYANRNYDDRNEALCKFAHKVVTENNEVFFPKI